MQVGDLVRMRWTGTLWLTLDIIADTVLVCNVKTNAKEWMMKTAFEVAA